MAFYLFLLMAQHHPTRAGPETAGEDAGASWLCGDAGLGCGAAVRPAVSEAAAEPREPSLTVPRAGGLSRRGGDRGRGALFPLLDVLQIPRTRGHSRSEFERISHLCPSLRPQTS